ncbi:hypothetical protein OG311_38040 (plasmid) [Streptomyces sp. NBC_01343]|uniref:hypothetical protein n=1 Tax=Streptomyces sp. NBC_01343 TaxID=2903832 RepID=UPI002E144507|nr:hypothetical protein OG311_38040 [Streptomyces sp. NBC_01343]
MNETKCPECPASAPHRAQPAPPVAPQPCPRCGGEVLLTSRDWAACASAECRWGGMTAELTGAVAPGWD